VSGGNRNRYSNDEGRKNRYGNDGGSNRYGKDRGNRYSYKDRNNNNHHGNAHRHKVFRNGVWVWVYDPYYTYGDNCAWLYRRASLTGSPYWWDRYEACVAYDYY
jgi:hypothetical protein